MIRSLRWIAAVGLGAGIASLAIAYVLGGSEGGPFWDRWDRWDHWDHWDFSRQACGGDKPAPGAPSERHLAWSGGDRIDISVPASVKLRVGEGSDIVVRGSPDTIAHVELRGDRLLLDCRWQYPTRDVEVTLPGRAFRQIRLTGSTQLVMENVNQPELDLRITGSGGVHARGTVERLSIRVSGSGRARLAELATKVLTLKITGSGNVEAAPTDEADVSIAGAGTLTLQSRPTRLDTHITGSGRIRQAPAEASEKK